MTNNLMKRLTSVLVVFSVLLSVEATAETIRFQCSWDNKAPIVIAVDTESMSANRDDGGHGYRLAKISKWGVWLIVVDPRNVVATAIQMIERSSAFDDPSKGGRWYDTIMPLSGNVSTISGGICWEGTR